MSKKMDELNSILDFRTLENDLQKAVHQDRLYWLRNSAKIRAATGNTSNYEEFRQIVDAAHLTPIEKKDCIKPADMKTVWNPLFNKKKAIDY